MSLWSWTVQTETIEKSIVKWEMSAAPLAANDKTDDQ